MSYTRLHTDFSLGLYIDADVGACLLVSTAYRLERNAAVVVVFCSNVSGHSPEGGKAKYEPK